MQFHTATINSWKHLLKEDSFKDIIINCLKWLDEHNRAITHGFVIMPNHIHLLWTVLETGNQPPAQVLASYTAHEFKKKMKSDGTPVRNLFVPWSEGTVWSAGTGWSARTQTRVPRPPANTLSSYISTQSDRDYHFWKRRPKAIPVIDRNMASRVLDYIHNNPLQEHWKLAEFPEDYHYSSARFYLEEQSEFKFKFIKHVGDYV